MEGFVKNQFEKAIKLCADNVIYDNVKIFMQDMISENISMLSKDTPTWIIEFIYRAAYDITFTEEFRDCLQDVVYFIRHTEPLANSHVRYLRSFSRFQSELIKKQADRIAYLEDKMAL
jgi:hypothetical protein